MLSRVQVPGGKKGFPKKEGRKKEGQDPALKARGARGGHAARLPSGTHTWAGRAGSALT